MRRWFATVRVRTTAFAALVVTVALLAGAILLVVVQQRALTAGLERSITGRASDIAALARGQRLPKDLTAAREEDAFTQVVGANGKVLAASENLRNELRVLPLEPAPGSAVLVNRTVGSIGSRFLVVARGVATPNGRVTIYAGETTEAVDDATQSMERLLAIGIPLLIGLVAVTTWRVTGRALRPVEAIRAEVSEIGETELHRRVPEPASYDEVGKLARTMNAMLARLDDAADRQRRFVSDASHELQSPLTSLRARFEVNLAARTEPNWRAGEDEALVEVTEMQRLVDDLLTLARLEAGVDTVHVMPVDLDDLVLHEAERIRTLGRISVDVSRVSGGQVFGDPDQLRRALRNVMDNAERHANQRVSIAVFETDSMTEVRIVDDGPGIPIEHRTRIFERFGRIDDARTRDGASTGLGLAITREIVTVHGGVITVETDGPGACFVIRFPRTDAALI